MTLPLYMQYVDATNADEAGGLRLNTAPLPEPKADEVLIRVMAAGVNRPDILQRKGLYPPPKDASPILGLEVAGEVLGVGHLVQDYKKGDRVCALANGGGYAEYCTVPASQCLPWPKGYDALQAGALPENYFTVWANLFQNQRLAKGESLLVHGGSSGIGITAIQLAHELGNMVYATAGSAEKCAACVKSGADAAINYREEDFEARITELTGGKGVDVVFDMVGAPYMQKNLNCLKPDGRLVQIAVMLGSKVESFNLAQVMMKRLVITGSTLRPRTTVQKADIAKSLRERLWPVLDVGCCAPMIHAVFPLSEVAAAHMLMESSQHIGKIMLKVAD